jgi:hypothetical protein
MYTPSGDGSHSWADHELKVCPEFFPDLLSGAKPFEVRRDDRNFQVEHWLRLREWHPESGYTGAEVHREITYVLRGMDAARFGVQTGFCVLGLGPAEMALCESEMLVLKPDRPYVFRVMPDCERCARIAAVHERPSAPPLITP